MELKMTTHCVVACLETRKNPDDCSHVAAVAMTANVDA
jgi:hypothetical protein